MNPHSTQPPLAVIEHFGHATAGLTWHRAEPGFSGAVVWRGDDISGSPRVALKGWPLSTAAEHVERVHSWLASAARLPFVPTVFAGARKQSAVLADGRFWDACKWMPGAPREAPTEAEVRAACAAVAQLHRCWPALSGLRPCRGVRARLDMLNDHHALLEEWNRGLPPLAPEVDLLLRRGVGEAVRLAGAAIRALRRWETWPLRIQPCVRDLRGEHVLFEAERVTGIVDYGAMAVDHPAVDLARLLDDHAASDEPLFGAGLRAYRDAGAPLDVPDEFVHLLARTGTVCSIMGWLVRFFVRRETVFRASAVTVRLEKLIERAGRITHF